MHSFIICLARKTVAYKTEDEVFTDMEREGSMADYVTETFGKDVGTEETAEDIFVLINDLLSGDLVKKENKKFTISRRTVETALFDAYDAFDTTVKNLTKKDFCVGINVYYLEELLGANSDIYVYDGAGPLMGWTNWLRKLYKEDKDVEFQIVQVFDYHV